MPLPTTHPAIFDDEEYTLSHFEALLASTLALMTSSAQAALACGRVESLAPRIAGNLEALTRHPALSASMHLMLRRLQTRWQTAACPSLHPAGTSDPGSTADAARWLPCPEVIQ